MNPISGVYVLMALGNIRSTGDLAFEALCAYGDQKRAEQRAATERRHGPEGTVFVVQYVPFTDEPPLREEWLR